MNKKAILLVILAIALGSLSGYFVYAQNNDCSNLPTFHYFFIKRVVECLQDNDRTLTEEIERLNSRIDLVNRTRLP